MRTLIGLVFAAWLVTVLLIATTPSQALNGIEAPSLVRPTSQYPFGSVPETISATGTTTAFTATLPVGTAFQTVYICGVVIDAAATAGTVVPATITGTVSGTLNFLEYVSPIATPGQGGRAIIFDPCIPANAVNTAIVVNAGAAGTAGIASISAWGYLL